MSVGKTVKKDFTLIIDNEDVHNGTGAEAGIKDELQRWPLFGLSVGSFLQVIAMDQQTCIMEVYKDTHHIGHFCFVAGELFDAVLGELDGETAAMEMIAWENVRLNIKQILNASNVTRRIDKNLMLLLMESTRRRDERLDNGEVPDPEEAEELDDLEDVAESSERARFDACLKLMVEDMEEALIAASIVKVGEEKIMATYQAVPEAALAFMRLTKFLRKSFAANTPLELGDHYILDLKDQQVLVALIIGEHQWCMVFNKVQCTLGLFRNVIMPKVIRAYNAMN